MDEIKNKHISIASIGEINQICAPLFKSTNINLFYFVRAFDNGHYAILLSDPEWLQHKLSNDYMLVPPISKKILDKKFGYLIPARGKYKQVVTDLRNIFKKYNPFDLIEGGDGYFDLYGFTTNSEEDNLVNFYLNNRDIFEDFKRYFRDKAASLIQMAENDKIVAPKHMQANFDSQIIKICHSNKNNNCDINEELLNNIKPDRYSCYNKEGLIIYITKREMECLKYLVRGRSIKETANFLNISPRTVESHLEKLKAKTGCYRKSDLITFYEDNFYV
jgi:DNA-binding CsgD family transcriptional regulator